MTAHFASCSCGQLTLVARGDPIRVSMCHCLAGPAFPAPGVCVHEMRRHPGVSVPDGAERFE